MKIREFFEDDTGRLSMTRLLCFLSFAPSTYIVIKNAEGMNISEILGWYLGAYVLGYVGGKASDAVSSFSRRRGRNDT